MDGGSFENQIGYPGVGALLGLAVGDALGTTYEFERIDQPPYPTLATSPATDIVGGGPFELAAGQITDDTQMAVCLAKSLAAKRELDMLDLATRYVAWYQHAFDVGNQTAAALGAIESGASVGSAGRTVWHTSGRRAAGNGSLMRTAPIGVFFADALRRGRLEMIIEASLADSLITHADPRCAIACAAFNAAIARGVIAESPSGGPQGPSSGPQSPSGGRQGPSSGPQGPSSGPQDPSSGPQGPSGGPLALGTAQLEVARTAIAVAAAKLRELYDDDRDDLALIDAAVEDLERDLDTCCGGDPDVYRVNLDLRRMAGFVRVAFRLAFWHLVHTPSWRDAVVDVASRGGDADTNAAIVGALLGSRDGARAIPRAWIERVLAATQKGPADWAEAHHPRHLLALLV